MSLERKRQRQREWYQRNKEKQKRWVHERRVRIRAQIREYRAKQHCAECGYDFHPAALEFHHPDKKEFNISQLPGKGWGWKRILQELEACVVLCANCHRIEHA